MSSFRLAMLQEWLIFWLFTHTCSRLKGQSFRSPFPSCFGVTRQLKMMNLHYIILSNDQPAVHMFTPSGLSLENKPNSCIIAIQLPSSPALYTVSIFLRSTYVGNMSDILSLNKWKLVFKTGLTRVGLQTIRETSLFESNSGIQHMNVSADKISSSTIYVTLANEGASEIANGIRVAFTLTPVFRCIHRSHTMNKLAVYSGKYYLICGEYPLAGLKTFGLCVSRSLYCDGYPNCIPYKTFLSDEPSDRTLCSYRKTGRKFKWDLVLGFLAAFFAISIIFSLAFYATEVCTTPSRASRFRSLFTCSRTHPAALADGESTTTDAGLPLPPPMYDSIQSMPERPSCAFPGRKPWRELKNQQRFEAPPSYTRDIQDETGVFPTFLHNYYHRQRPRRSRGWGRRTQRTEPPVRMVRTQETISFESWADSLGAGPTENDCEELPEYQDLPLQVSLETSKESSKITTEPATDEINDI